MYEDRCTQLSNISYTNFAASVFILLGILVSYLPQHIRIISRRSSFGLSPYFVLLGTTSGTCVFANILILSRADVACCRVVNGFACFAGLLGIGQVGMQWSCFVVILLLFLIFFPRATPPTAHPDKDDGPTFRTALTVALICVLHALLTAILSLYFTLTKSHAVTLRWAGFLGVLSTLLALVQYLPQIYTTYRLKAVGSLSIPMMCIQTPGSFVWAGSLAARMGPEGWSTWGVLVVTGCLQGTLLAMGTYYELRRRREARKEIEGRIAAAEEDEYTPTTTTTAAGRGNGYGTVAVEGGITSNLAVDRTDDVDASVTDARNRSERDDEREETPLLRRVET